VCEAAVTEQITILDSGMPGAREHQYNPSLRQAQKQAREQPDVQGEILIGKAHRNIITLGRNSEDVIDGQLLRTDIRLDFDHFI
jgi:hypothetical protein